MVLWKSVETYTGRMSRVLSLSDQLARNAKRQQDAYAELSVALGANDPTGRERHRRRSPS
jgi:hypothetical protein